MRRTSYAGETNTSLHPTNFGPSSTSEPKLYRKGTVGRAGSRPRSRNQQENGRDPEILETSRKLQRMKAQSKKTFKFRKTRRRDGHDSSPTVATIESAIEEQSPSPPTATTMTQTPTSSSVVAKASSSLRPVSLTATVIRRAKQRKKMNKNPGVEIVIDDDSISSARTSSTVGYRDSFGDNDDGCFHLLERYDDSNAVMRLLQSRQRAARRESQSSTTGLVTDRALGDMGREALLLEEAETIVEMTDSGQDTETELSSHIIYEHQDENTLI